MMYVTGTDYIIVCERRQEKLERIVNTYLEKGYAIISTASSDKLFEVHLIKPTPSDKGEFL